MRCLPHLLPCRGSARGHRPFALFAILVALAVLPVSAGRERASWLGKVTLQLLHLSGWQGQIDPVAVEGVGDVGGAAAISAYWKAERAARPNTLALLSGGSFGASEPLSGLFNDVPAILAMNLMGVDADTLGNHSFDRGLPALLDLIDRARFPFVSANLRNLTQNLPGVTPFRLFTRGGVRVAVIGITNPDSPVITRPGNMGTLVPTDPAGAANAARRQAARLGATVFVGIVHLGVDGTDPQTGRPVGALLDFAAGVRGFDVILGDGGDLTFQARRNGALVVQDRLRGATYSRTLLTCDRASGRVVNRAVQFVTPRVDAVTPDPAVEAVIAPFRSLLAARLDSPAGLATDRFPYREMAGWTAELESGNLVADALRSDYGTDFAVQNAGGIRDSLPSRYQPGNHALRRGAPGYAAGPPFDLVSGDFYSLLPFNNFAVTREVTGQLLWTILENGVSLIPQPSGRFLQVSGLRFVYDSSRPAGSRIVSVTRDDGTPIPADGTRYTITVNDFINSGGDGYAMLADGSGVTRDSLAEAAIQYARGAGALTPSLEGRITDRAAP